MTKSAIVVPPDLMLLNCRAAILPPIEAGVETGFQNICPQASGRALTAKKSSDILSF
jgi:hypothetical protein